jgi:hypothetical protein
MQKKAEQCSVKAECQGGDPTGIQYSRRARDGVFLQSFPEKEGDKI